jgi:hypothetical protein
MVGLPPLGAIARLVAAISASRRIASAKARKSASLSNAARSRARTRSGNQKTCTFGIGTTKRPPHSRIAAICAATSSFRFQGRMRT